MQDHIIQALELVKVQAALRVMTEEEMLSMTAKLAEKIACISSAPVQEQEGEGVEAPASAAPCDPWKSIKEKSIVCLECGKRMKVITKKHLALHGLDAVSYREKWGFQKDTALSCKALQKARRQKMNEMKIWEKASAARQSIARINFGSIEDL